MTMEAVKGGFSYLAQNPMYLVRAAKNATRLSMALPLDLLRYFIDRRPKGKGPDRIELTAAPPGLGVGLTVDLYGTKLDVSANVAIDAVENAVDSLKLSLRVQELAVKAPPGSPAAMMVGSLDLSRPGNLMKMMPMKHNALVDAHDDQFVIDLLKIKKLAENRTLRRILAATADVVTIKDVHTEEDLLVIGFSLSLASLPVALARLRSA